MFPRMTIDALGVGQRIAQARRDAGYKSQEELAEAMGRLFREKGVKGKATRQMIGNWEKGQPIPPWDKLEMLADMLAVTEEWVMFGERRAEQLASEKPVMEYLDPEEFALIQEFRHIERPWRESLLGVAKSFHKDHPIAPAQVQEIRRRGRGP